MCFVYLILFLQSGVPKESLGVIAPYRAQVAQISLFLQDADVVVNTADRFQGKDKEVIILSCTKSFDKVQYVNRDVCVGKFFNFVTNQ